MRNDLDDIELALEFVAELESREQRIRELKTEIATAEVKKTAILKGYLR